MFKKAKTTFLMAAGRKGAPSAIAPRLSTSTRSKSTLGGAKSSKKPAVKPIGKARVVKNGAPLKTGKVTPNRNAKTGKSANFKLSGKLARVPQSTKMSKAPRGGSATHSPQSTSNTARPRG